MKVRKCYLGRSDSGTDVRAVYNNPNRGCPNGTWSWGRSFSIRGLSTWFKYSDAHTIPTSFRGTPPLAYRPYTEVYLKGRYYYV